MRARVAVIALVLCACEVTVDLSEPASSSSSGSSPSSGGSSSSSGGSSSSRAGSSSGPRCRETITPTVTGTLENFPELQLLQVAPVFEMQSAYFRTTETNRSFRRGVVELRRPEMEQLESARLHLALPGGFVSAPVPPVVHRVGSYDADLVLDLDDHDRAVTPFTSITTDDNESDDEVVLDVTGFFQTAPGHLGLRVQLEQDPDDARMIAYGADFTPSLELVYAQPPHGRCERIIPDNSGEVPRCPLNQALFIHEESLWQRYFGDTPVHPADVLRFRFNALSDGDGPIAVHFITADGSTSQIVVDVPGDHRWHLFEGSHDRATGSSSLRVDGSEQSAQFFARDDGQGDVRFTVSGMGCGTAGDGAWIDNISVELDGEHGTELLWSDGFDDDVDDGISGSVAEVAVPANPGSCAP